MVLTVSVSTARTSKFSHLLRLADNFWWWVTIRGKQSNTGAGKCICDHVFVFSSAPYSASFLVLFQATALRPRPVTGRNTGGAWKKKKIQNWRRWTALLGAAVVNTLKMHICIGYKTQKRAMLGQIMCNWSYLDELLCCNDVLQGATSLSFLLFYQSKHDKMLQSSIWIVCAELIFVLHLKVEEDT